MYLLFFLPNTYTVLSENLALQEHFGNRVSGVSFTSTSVMSTKWKLCSLIKNVMVISVQNTMTWGGGHNMWSELITSLSATCRTI